MGLEIERKYRLRSDDWKANAGPGQRYRQGYLSLHKDRTVRLRVEGDRAVVTIKGRSHGAVRSEYEYPIPLSDAEEMLRDLCLKPLIEKTRFRIPYQGFTWEVDVFEGDNQGLVVAEVELSDPQQLPPLPPWAGQDVTDDPRYFNARLIEHPFKTWRQKD